MVTFKKYKGLWHVVLPKSGELVPTIHHTILPNSNMGRLVKNKAWNGRVYCKFQYY